MGYTIYKTDGTIFFQSTKDSLLTAVIEKFAIDRNLYRANLSGADLSGADLYRAKNIQWTRAELPGLRKLLIEGNRRDKDDY